MKIKMILSENFIRFIGMLDVLFVFFFRKILDDTPLQDYPIAIHMSGIQSKLMRHLLDFLYSGQAYIEVCFLDQIIKLN